jgi:hypothetical protein
VDVAAADLPEGAAAEHVDERWVRRGAASAVHNAVDEAHVAVHSCVSPQRLTIAVVAPPPRIRLPTERSLGGGAEDVIVLAPAQRSDACAHDGSRSAHQHPPTSVCSISWYSRRLRAGVPLSGECNAHHVPRKAIAVRHTAMPAPEIAEYGSPTW